MAKPQRVMDLTTHRVPLTSSRECQDLKSKLWNYSGRYHGSGGYYLDALNIKSRISYLDSSLVCVCILAWVEHLNAMSNVSADGSVASAPDQPCWGAPPGRAEPVQIIKSICSHARPMQAGLPPYSALVRGEHIGTNNQQWSVQYQLLDTNYYRRPRSK